MISVISHCWNKLSPVKRIPSWHILTAHAQPFRGARDLAFCLKVPLDSLLLWASSKGSGETAWMRRLAWTFAARIGDMYQIRLTRSNLVTTNWLSMRKQLCGHECGYWQAVNSPLCFPCWSFECHSHFRVGMAMWFLSDTFHFYPNYLTSSVVK